MNNLELPPDDTESIEDEQTLISELKFNNGSELNHFIFFRRIMTLAGINAILGYFEASTKRDLLEIGSSVLVRLLDNHFKNNTPLPLPENVPKEMISDMVLSFTFTYLLHTSTDDPNQIPSNLSQNLHFIIKFLPNMLVKLPLSKESSLRLKITILSGLAWSSDAIKISLAENLSKYLWQSDKIFARQCLWYLIGVVYRAYRFMHEPAYKKPLDLALCNAITVMNKTIFTAEINPPDIQHFHFVINGTCYDLLQRKQPLHMLLHIGLLLASGDYTDPLARWFAHSYFKTIVEHDETPKSFHHCLHTDRLIAKFLLDLPFKKSTKLLDQAIESKTGHGVLSDILRGLLLVTPPEAYNRFWEIWDYIVRHQQMTDQSEAITFLFDPNLHRYDIDNQYYRFVKFALHKFSNNISCYVDLLHLVYYIIEVSKLGELLKPIVEGLNNDTVALILENDSFKKYILSTAEKIINAPLNNTYTVSQQLFAILKKLTEAGCPEANDLHEKYRKKAHRQVLMNHTAAGSTHKHIMKMLPAEIIQSKPKKQKIAHNTSSSFCKKHAFSSTNSSSKIEHSFDQIKQLLEDYRRLPNLDSAYADKLEREVKSMDKSPELQSRLEAIIEELESQVSILRHNSTYNN